MRDAAKEVRSMSISSISDSLPCLTEAGFNVGTECSDAQYERVAWTREGVRIVIEHEIIHYTLFLSMYLRDREVDVNRLFEKHGLPYRRKYEYPDKTCLEKAIIYMSDAVTGFISKYRDDPDGLKAALEKALILESTETEEERYLRAADQQYLAGNYHQAVHFYEHAGSIMSDLQRKRYNRAKEKLS